MLLQASARRLRLHRTISIGILVRPNSVRNRNSANVRGGLALLLAWHGLQVGGDVLFVEAGRIPGGAKGLIMTGQLESVMHVSVQAALTWVRSQAEAFGIDPHLFRRSDIHVHVPAGAIAKDGPSAGITIAMALISALTGRRVNPDFAMTGEITLGGDSSGWRH